MRSFVPDLSALALPQLSLWPLLRPAKESWNGSIRRLLSAAGIVSRWILISHRAIREAVHSSRSFWIEVATSEMSA